MSTKFLLPPAAITQAITNAMQSWSTTAGAESVDTLLRTGAGLSPFSVLAGLASSVISEHTTASDSTSTTVNAGTSALVAEAVSLAGGYFAANVTYTSTTSPPGGSSSWTPGTPTSDVAGVISKFGNALTAVLNSIPVGS